MLGIIPFVQSRNKTKMTSVEVSKALASSHQEECPRLGVIAVFTGPFIAMSAIGELVKKREREKSSLRLSESSALLHSPTWYANSRTILQASLSLEDGSWRDDTTPVGCLLWDGGIYACNSILSFSVKHRISFPCFVSFNARNILSTSFSSLFRFPSSLPNPHLICFPR